MKREVVVIGTRTLVFGIPDFIHDFDTHHHTFKGSLRRHLAVEHLLVAIRCFLLDFDALPFYRFAEAFLDLLFGFNCGFPRRDIARFVMWSLRCGAYTCLDDGGQ